MVQLPLIWYVPNENSIEFNFGGGLPISALF